MTSQKMKCGCSNETMRPSAVFRFAMGTRKCCSASDYTDLDQSSNQDIAAPTVRKSNPDRREPSTERAKRPLRTFRPSVAVVYVRNRSGRRSNRNECSFANGLSSSPSILRSGRTRRPCFRSSRPAGTGMCTGPAFERSRARAPFPAGRSARSRTAGGTSRRGRDRSRFRSGTTA